MMQSAVEERVLQGARDMLLSCQILKRRWTVFSGDDFVIQDEDLISDTIWNRLTFVMTSS
jgi:hypothetical protein